jgi:hypothetical protein
MRLTRSAIAGCWVRVKCLHFEEFVVGPSRRHAPPGSARGLLRSRRIAGQFRRAGTETKQEELGRLWCRLQPLSIDKSPLDVTQPSASRSGSPLCIGGARARCRKIPLRQAVNGQGYGVPDPGTLILCSIDCIVPLVSMVSGHLETSQDSAHVFRPGVSSHRLQPCSESRLSG